MSEQDQPLRLWKTVVTYDVELMITTSDDEPPDDFDIREAAEEEMTDHGMDRYVSFVRTPALVTDPSALGTWTRCIPRGSHEGDTTCEQIVKRFQAEQNETAAPG